MNKLTKFIIVTLALTMVTLLSMGEAKAAEVKTSCDYQYKILDETKKTAALTFVSNPGKVVKIPKKIEGYKIVQVGAVKKVITQSDKANHYVDYLYNKNVDRKSFRIFSENDAENVVKQVIIPDTIKNIGAYAFVGCSKLKRVKFPSSLNSISCCAFINCSDLKKILIPRNVNVISVGAFMNCRKLSQINIYSRNLVIGEESISTLGIEGKTPALSINIKSTTRNLKIMYDAITAHNFKQMTVDSHVKTLSIEQLGNPIKKLMIKGKLTKITGSKVMGTPKYKKTRKYLCASKVYAKKNSNAWKFCKKAYWPNMKGYSGENYEDDTYFTEDNIGIKPVKLVAYK